MKKSNTLICFLILLSSLTVMSCGGDDSDTPDEQGDGVFTATVASTTLNSNASEAKAVHTKIDVSDNYSLYVVGYDKTAKRMINFTIYSDVVHVPGTFSLTLISANSAYYYENREATDEAVWISPDASNLDLNLSHGTVTFSEITSARAKGTFSFTAYKIGEDDREITNGSFDVPLKRQYF